MSDFVGFDIFYEIIHCTCEIGDTSEYVEYDTDLLEVKKE